MRTARGSASVLWLRGVLVIEFRDHVDGISLSIVAVDGSYVLPSHDAQSTSGFSGIFSSQRVQCEESFLLLLSRFKSKFVPHLTLSLLPAVNLNHPRGRRLQPSLEAHPPLRGLEEPLLSHEKIKSRIEQRCQMKHSPTGSAAQRLPGTDDLD
jgi:hypothetical protein